MKVLDDGRVLEMRFSPLHSIVVDRDAAKIVVDKKVLKFAEVRGFWKNYRFRGKKKVYYVIILTNTAMIRATPEMDEYDVDEVIRYLRSILGDDKYAR